MKKIWVICETVDLGYRMLNGYASYDKALAEYERLQAQAIARKVKSLMSSKITIILSLDEAVKYANGLRYYELESVKVEE